MQIYQTKLLNSFPCLKTYFTNRDDGNLAFHVGDKEERVVQNHKKLSKKLGYEYKNLVHMKQIHSNDVKIIERDDNFLNPPSCDALITNKKKKPLMVMVADCAPLLFYDDVTKTIAVAHAGRAGAFKNIVQKLVNSFVDDFHAKAENICVSVGANIKKCSYEVGEEIVKEAQNLHLSYAIEQRDAKYFLDINAILHAQLLEAGLQEKNIEFSPECSYCSENSYFSYRREKQTGRFAGVIFLT